MDLLLVVSQKGDWPSWVDFFLTGVSECAEEAIAQAEGLEKLRQQYHERVQAKRGSVLVTRLIDRLFSSPSITIPSAANNLNITQPGASKIIQKLEEAKILREVTKRRKGQIFVAQEILSFMSDSSRSPHSPTSKYVTRSAEE